MAVLTQFRGRLSTEQVAKGMNAAARNARRLYDDANLLFEVKRFPTASSLAVLSIEEAGKLALLRGILAAPSEKHLKEAWRAYRDHRSKNAAWIIGELAATGERHGWRICGPYSMRKATTLRFSME